MNTIRSAILTDVSAINALMQAEPGFWRDDWRPDVLECALNASNCLAYIWEENGQVLGFVCAHDLGFRAYLSELIVAPGQRGKSIGCQLVRRVEADLVARGCTVLIADVWKDAEKFYRSLGWSPPEVILLRQRLPPQTGIG